MSSPDEFLYISANEIRRNAPKAFTYLVGDAHANNPDIKTLDTPDFLVQQIDFTCWITVGDKNKDIWYTWTVSVGSVEYFCPRQSQSAGRIGVTAAILNLLDGVPERLNVGKLIQVELQECLVTFKQFYALQSLRSVCNTCTSSQTFSVVASEIMSKYMRTTLSTNCLYYDPKVQK